MEKKFKAMEEGIRKRKKTIGEKLNSTEEDIRILQEYNRKKALAIIS